MTKKATKAEQERIDRMRPLGCVACAVIGIPNVQDLELNHLLDGHRRLGHWYSIFLCVGHHRGYWSKDQFEIMSVGQMKSIADSRNAFSEVYGTERDLWEKVQLRLKLPTLWPLSKILPRKAS